MNEHDFWGCNVTVDERLKKVKYGVLAVLLLSAAVSVTWTDRLV